MAEWLRNGLQNRVHQFNSGRGLHQQHQMLTLMSQEAASTSLAAHQAAYHPSGKGISGQAISLSLAALRGSYRSDASRYRFALHGDETAALTVSSSRSNSASLMALSQPRERYRRKRPTFPDCVNRSNCTDPAIAGHVVSEPLTGTRQSPSHRKPAFCCCGGSLQLALKRYIPTSPPAIGTSPRQTGSAGSRRQAE